MMIVKLVVMKEMTPVSRPALRYPKVGLAGWPEQSETLSRCCAALLAWVCAKSEGAHLTAAAQMMCLPLTSRQLG